MAKPLFQGAITDVHGVRVGQAQDERALTGVTVVLCGGEGAVIGADVRGAAPARGRSASPAARRPWKRQTP